MAKKDIIVVLEVDDRGTPKIKKAVASTRSELKKLRTSTKQTSAGFTQMKNSVSKSGQSMSVFKKIAGSTWGQMAAGMGVVVGVQAGIRMLKDAITDVIRVGREFEKTWANVTTMMTVADGKIEGTNMTLDDMKWQLISMSPVLGDTTELARGMYQVLSASIEPAKAIEFLGEAAKSAKAGVTDVFTAVDALTTVINAYGLEAEDVTKVSDVMFQTVKRGKLTYEGMSGALGTVVPVAAQVGIEFTEIAAGMATLTRSGIDVNTTTVQLRQILVSLLKPQEKAIKYAEKIGLEFNTAAVASMGLANWLKHLHEKTGGSAEASAILFGNVRALSGVMGLAANDAVELAKDTGLMTDAWEKGGQTQEAFAKQMESIDFWMETSKNTMNKLKIAFFEGLIDPARKGIKSAGELEQKTGELVSATKLFGNILGWVLKTRLSGTVKALHMLSTAQEMGAKGFLMLAFSMTGAGIPAARKMYREHQRNKEAAAALGEGVDWVRGKYDDFVGVLKKGWNALKEAQQKMDETGNTSLEMMELFEKLKIKTRDTLVVEMEVAEDRLGKVISSGKATKDQIGKLADELVKMKESLGRDVSPELLKLTTNFINMKKKITDSIPSMTNLQIETLAMTESIKKLVSEGYREDEILRLLGKQIIDLYEEGKKFEKVTGQLMPDALSNLGVAATNATTEVKLLKKESVDVNKVLERAVERYDAVAGSMLGLTPQFLKAVKYIRDLGKAAEESGLKTKLQLRTELEKLEKNFRHLRGEGQLTANETVKGVDQIIAIYKELGLKVPAEYKKIRKESKKAAIEFAEDWAKSLEATGILFKVLGDQVGGAFGNVITATGSLVQQVGATIKSGVTNVGDILGAVSQQVGALGGAIGEMISGAKDSFASLGASIGGMIGGIFSPLGKAIGSFFGGLIGGLFKKKKTAEQIAKEAAEKAQKDLEGRVKSIQKTLTKFGEVSEATAEKIAKSWQSGLEGFAAVSLHFADVIRDVGITQSNLNDLWVRTGEIIHHVQDGFLDAEEGIDVLNESFNLLIEGARKLGKEGSQAMIDFIRNVRESGLEVGAVTEYILEQLDKIPASLETLIKNVIPENLVEITDERALRLENRLKGLAQVTMDTFNAMLSEGRTYLETMRALEGPLTALFDQYERLGKEIPSFLVPFKEMIDLMQEKPKIFEDLDAAISILQSLSNTAYLTQGSFDALAESATKFAKSILGVEGNLNKAMRSMELTQSQIMALLPIVAQFVGSAALFGIGIPEWMKTFVTKQLGVDWSEFKQVAKTQANSGIATVEKLKQLLDTTRDQHKRDRDVVNDFRRENRNRLDDLIRVTRNLGDNMGIKAQHGVHGVFTGPQSFHIEPGMRERVDIAPVTQQGPGAAGGVTIIERPMNIKPLMISKEDLGMLLIEFFEEASRDERVIWSPKGVRG
jgi:TP901 family phage tail tape measure protein